MRTGLDLVREQLKIASGEKLSFTQEDVEFKGHTIECRICAEDSENNFMPSTGKITYMKNVLSNGMREDTGIEQGNEISVYYDPMISKLISNGATREIAIEKMKRALRDYKLVGIKSNIAFLLNLLESEEYVSGNYHTQFIEKEFLGRMSSQKNIPDEDTNAAVALAAVLFKEQKAQKLKTVTSSNSHSNNFWLNKRTESYR
jgi:acetyl/propionyl-CoA carboxylase alpha subunit